MVLINTNTENGLVDAFDLEHDRKLLLNVLYVRGGALDSRQRRIGLFSTWTLFPNLDSTQIQRLQLIQNSLARSVTRTPSHHL